MGRCLSLTIQWGQHGAEVVLLSTGQLPHHPQPSLARLTALGWGPGGSADLGQPGGAGQSQVHPAWIEQYPSLQHSH